MHSLHTARPSLPSAAFLSRSLTTPSIFCSNPRFSACLCRSPLTRSIHLLLTSAATGCARPRRARRLPPDEPVRAAQHRAGKRLLVPYARVPCFCVLLGVACACMCRANACGVCSHVPCASMPWLQRWLVRARCQEYESLSRKRLGISVRDWSCVRVRMYACVRVRVCVRVHSPRRGRCCTRCRRGCR